MTIQTTLPATAKTFLAPTKIAKFKPLKAASHLSDDELSVIISAAQEYLKLQSRDEHPDGYFDTAGRFFLEKKCSCCMGIRSPSRSFPYSELVHARTAKHVAHSFGVKWEESLVRKFSKVIDQEGVAGVYALLKDREFFAAQLLEIDLGI